MSPRKEIEAPPLAPVVKWEETEAVEGEYMGSHPFSAKEKTLVHDFSGAPNGAEWADDNGDFSAWGTMDLDRKLSQIEAGTYVYITFLGEERVKGGGSKRTKRFKIEVDD